MTEATTTPPTSEPVAGPVQRKLGQAAEARWYCLDRDGVAMLCKDKADAQAQVIENDDCWPARAPHRAVLLGDVTGLHAELRHARDGLTKGRTRMREDNELLREVIGRMVAGIDHLDKLAREWEPDHSSGADRRGWLLAKDARDDAVRALGPNDSMRRTQRPAQE